MHLASLSPVLPRLSEEPSQRATSAFLFNLPPSMPDLYKGQYEVALDGKNRFRIPTALLSANPSPEYILSRGFEACVLVFPKQEWEKIEDKVSGMDIGRREVRDFYRKLMMWAFPCPPDPVMRVQIPTALAEVANLERQATILGVYNHFQIWSPVELKICLNNQSGPDDDQDDWIDPRIFGDLI